GPKIGQLAGRIKKAVGAEAGRLQGELDDLKAGPARLKRQIDELEGELAGLEPELEKLLLMIPQPPDPDVPDGAGSEGNVEIRRWSPPGFDPAKPFAGQKGFVAKSHAELGEI